MTIRCSVCKLALEKQQAIATALQESVPLQVISDRTGLSKSSIWRHSKHLARADSQEKPPEAVSVPPETKTPFPVPRKPVAPDLPVRTPTPEPPLDVEAKRRQALERCELLFREALAGLEASKQPVVVNKGAGILEIPGDLRARAAFVRAARDVLSLDAELSGVYDAAPTLNSDVVFANVILLPKLADLEPPRKPEPKVIDAVPEPAGSRTDGRTPDRGE